MHPGHVDLLFQDACDRPGNLQAGRVKYAVLILILGQPERWPFHQAVKLIGSLAMSGTPSISVSCSRDIAKPLGGFAAAAGEDGDKGGSGKYEL